jgi:hypothetical protein
MKAFLAFTRPFLNIYRGSSTTCNVKPLKPMAK